VALETVIVLAVSAALLALFLLAFHHNRFSLVAGLLFDIFLLVATAAALVLVVEYSGTILANVLLLIIALFWLPPLLFGGYALIAFFLANAGIVMRRESRSLANSLTLIAGIALILLTLASFLMSGFDPPVWLRALWFGLSWVLALFLLHGVVFLSSLLLCAIGHHRGTVDYIVVLGSGLRKDGKVTRLLAARVSKAIAFARAQAEKTGHMPVLLMSGGKGSDESRSEAAAMREYAIEQGFDPERILVEGLSTTTQENMSFSQAILDEREAGNPYNCVFATSNYHLLRAGRYARQAGLATFGLGAKTAGYFLPNAILREYAALAVTQRLPLGVAAVALFLLSLSLAVFAALLEAYVY
jgi:uncharacterized SAM-binding protein YcdF (DUF218 family)